MCVSLHLAKPEISVARTEELRLGFCKLEMDMKGPPLPSSPERLFQAGQLLNFVKKQTENQCFSLQRCDRRLFFMILCNYML